MTALERIHNNTGGVNLTALERREVSVLLRHQREEIGKLRARNANQKFMLEKKAEPTEPEPAQILCLLCGEWHAPGDVGKVLISQPNNQVKELPLACPNWTAEPLRPDGRFDRWPARSKSWDYKTTQPVQPPWTPWSQSPEPAPETDADGRAVPVTLAREVPIYGDCGGYPFDGARDRLTGRNIDPKAAFQFIAEATEAEKE